MLILEPLKLTGIQDFLDSLEHMPYMMIIIIMIHISNIIINQLRIIIILLLNTLILIIIITITREKLSLDMEVTTEVCTEAMDIITMVITIMVIITRNIVIIMDMGMSTVMDIHLTINKKTFGRVQIKELSNFSCLRAILTYPPP